MRNLVTFLALIQWEYGPHFDRDYDILKEQKQSELRRERLKRLKDPCPYCKFDVRAGKDKCDECGKEFYKTAEEKEEVELEQIIENDKLSKKNHGTISGSAVFGL